MSSLSLPSPRVQGSASAARRMGPAQRQELSLAVLARQHPATRSVTELARHHDVSRQFCYEQADRGQEALQQAFARPDEDRVLFHLPVTPNWIRQFVLAQLLIGHTSDRGILDLARTLLDYDGLSLGTIHNIAQAAVDQARTLNRQQDQRLLGQVRVGAHDEIFQARRPVLVGIDAQHTYCYLLARERHRDAVSWGVHLLELESRGLRLQRTVADAGQGLRAAQAELWSDVPCQGDVFHAERALGELVGFLERRALATMEAVDALARRLQRCQRHYDRGRKGARRRQRARMLGKRLAAARRELERALPLAEEVAMLGRWLREDVLAVAGEDLAVRRQLFDFLVEQLAQREALCPHRIGPVRRMLQEQRESLLGFVGVVDEQLQQVSERLSIPMHLVREMVRLRALDPGGCLYWQRYQRLRRKLGRCWVEAERAVAEVLAGVVRSSSAVENLNSRLRCYFFLRRQLGEGYLELLRFYLNHHPYARSRRRQRVGKSPAELLGGQPHPHWLEMLGYELFSRN